MIIHKVFRQYTACPCSRPTRSKTQKQQDQGSLVYLIDRCCARGCASPSASIITIVANITERSMRRSKGSESSSSGNVRAAAAGAADGDDNDDNGDDGVRFTSSSPSAPPPPSPSSALKVFLGLACGSVLCTAYLVAARNGREHSSTPPPSGALEVGRHDNNNARGGGIFRALNMLGFEGGHGTGKSSNNPNNDGQEGDEWVTCRAYEENNLGPHKKVCVCARLWCRTSLSLCVCVSCVSVGFAVLLCCCAPGVC